LHTGVDDRDAIVAIDPHGELNIAARELSTTRSAMPIAAERSGPDSADP
jgi:hypothetical protein